MKLPGFYAQSLTNAEMRRLVQTRIGDVKLQKASAAEEVPEGGRRGDRDKGRAPEAAEDWFCSTQCSYQCKSALQYACMLGEKEGGTQEAQRREETAEGRN